MPPDKSTADFEAWPPRCPICGTPGQARHRHPVASIAAAHTPPARDGVRYECMLAEIARLWPGGFVEACTCDACQLGFAWPMVAGDASFFELLHERSGYPRERWEFARARDDFVGTSGKVLDIGAGRGDFLARLADGVEKHGVEASPMLCSVLAERGITAHGDLTTAAAAGPYSVVTLFHVLQYFADPVATLAACRAMLTPASAEGGGRLLISVPNAQAGGAIDVLPSPPHPLTRWTRRAIERAIEAADLKVDGFAWIPQRPSSLVWAANAATRNRAATHPTSVAGKIDAMKRGKIRTALLSGLAVFALPHVLLDAPARLRRSQCFVVARAREG